MVLSELLDWMAVIGYISLTLVIMYFVLIAK